MISDTHGDSRRFLLVRSKLVNVDLSDVGPAFLQEQLEGRTVETLVRRLRGVLARLEEDVGINQTRAVSRERRVVEKAYDLFLQNSETFTQIEAQSTKLTFRRVS